MLIKASAQEEAEKLIADANTKAQRVSYFCDSSLMHLQLILPFMDDFKFYRNRVDRDICL